MSTAAVAAAAAAAVCLMNWVLIYELVVKTVHKAVAVAQFSRL